jgi:hypothetical protein
MQGINEMLVGLVFMAVAVSGPLDSHAAGPGPGKDADAVETILLVARKDNRAMGHLEHLVNTIGSRPVGSLSFLRACKWAHDEFKEYGLQNVHLEQCGEIKGDFPNDETAEFFGRYCKPAFGAGNDGEMAPIFNVIADIPGTQLPDEYVIVGAHLDSAPQGPGATDNGFGVAGAMEAARILAASGVKPMRTIRFILFGGEEAGLVGSKGYVEAHPDLLPKISAVYNMDHGADFISGIVATEPMVADMRKIFAAAMTLDTGMSFEVVPVEYLPSADPNCCAALAQVKEGAAGMRRVLAGEACGALSDTNAGEGIVIKEVTAEGDTLVKHIIMTGAPGAGKDIDLANLDLEALGISPENRKAGGDPVMKVIAMGSSDHAPFLAAGVPAFWWNQNKEGPIPYPVHTRDDTLDKVNVRHLEHSAVVIALGAFGTAGLDHLLSREKLTDPEGTAGGGGTPVKGSSCSPSCGGKD